MQLGGFGWFGLVPGAPRLVQGFVVRLVCALTCVAVMGRADLSAQTIFTCDFQDTMPFTCTYTQGGGGSFDFGDNTDFGPAACGAANTGWNRERVAPGPANGGYNDRGYGILVYCPYDQSGLATAFNQPWAAGMGIAPPAAIDNTWPTVFYMRMRVYFESAPLGDADAGWSTDQIRTMKWMIAHQGVYGGDQRVILFIEHGSMCGQSNTTYVCLGLARNIFSGTSGNPEGAPNDVVRVAVPVGEWAHLQWAWRHGVNGVSYLKAWLNNNAEGTPTDEQLSLTAVPTNPGGTSEWVRDDTGYNGQWDFGGVANNGTHFEDEFRVRIMDWQIDDAYDATWWPGSGPASTDVYRLRLKAPGH